MKSKKNLFIRFLKSFKETLKVILFTIWSAIIHTAKAIYYILELCFGFVKGIFFGISAFLASIALLVIAIAFLLNVFGISESKPFQENRDFWITTHSLSLEQRLLESFEKKQALQSEEERFQGELPVINEIETENEKRLQELLIYLKEDSIQYKD